MSVMNIDNLPIKNKDKIGKDFLYEENRNGILVTEKTKSIWAVELDLLFEFDRVCKECGLQYYLDSGTLLGAVRHRGFIPWDDDIDVVMLRDDYEVLIKEHSSMFMHPYFLQSVYTDKDYFREHAQLRNSSTTGILPYEKEKVLFNQGMFLDIFPLDYISEEKLESKHELESIITNKANLLKIMRKMSLHGDTIFRKIYWGCRSSWLKLVYGDLLSLHGEFEILVNSEPSIYVGDMLSAKSVSELKYFEKKWYEDPCELEFEGHLFPVPRNYDKVLEKYYGHDYMIPQKQPTLHGEIIIDPYVSFSEYI